MHIIYRVLEKIYLSFEEERVVLEKEYTNVTFELQVLTFQKWNRKRDQHFLAENEMRSYTLCSVNNLVFLKATFLERCAAIVQEDGFW